MIKTTEQNETLMAVMVTVVKLVEHHSQLSDFLTKLISTCLRFVFSIPSSDSSSDSVYKWIGYTKLSPVINWYPDQGMLFLSAPTIDSRLTETLSRIKHLRSMNE